MSNKERENAYWYLNQCIDQGEGGEKKKKRNQNAKLNQAERNHGSLFSCLLVSFFLFFFYRIFWCLSSVLVSFPVFCIVISKCARDNGMGSRSVKDQMTRVTIAERFREKNKNKKKRRDTQIERIAIYWRNRKKNGRKKKTQTHRYRKIVQNSVKAKFSNCSITLWTGIT